MAYEAVYRRERPDQYQPECRARRAARRLILVWPQASIQGPSRPSEVGCVFIIPSSILIDLFAIITLPKSTRRAPGRHIKNKSSKRCFPSAVSGLFRQMALGCDQKK